MGFLDSLKLDVWYMFILYMGTFGFFISLFYKPEGVEYNITIPFFFGLILLGLGEWKRERMLHQIKPPNVYTGGTMLISQKIQVMDVLGILLEIIGILLIAFSIWNLF